MERRPLEGGRPQSASGPLRNPPERFLSRLRFLEYITDPTRVTETAGCLLSSATQQFHRDLVDVAGQRSPPRPAPSRSPSPPSSDVKTQVSASNPASLLATRFLQCTESSSVAQLKKAATNDAGVARSLVNAKLGVVEKNAVNAPLTPLHKNPFVSYAGDIVAGECHGQGLLVCQDGSSTRGQFVRGEVTGVGIRTWADGSVYEGRFLNGEMHGDDAVEIRMSRGEHYNGPFRFNVREGRGMLQTHVRLAPTSAPAIPCAPQNRRSVSPNGGGANHSVLLPPQPATPLGKSMGSRTTYLGQFRRGLADDDDGLLVVLGASVTRGAFRKGVAEGHAMTLFAVPTGAAPPSILPSAALEGLDKLTHTGSRCKRNFGGSCVDLPRASHMRMSRLFPLSGEAYVGTYRDGREEGPQEVMVTRQWFQADGAEAPFKLTVSGREVSKSSDKDLAEEEEDVSIAYVGPFAAGWRVAVPSMTVPRSTTITLPAGCGPDGSIDEGVSLVADCDGERKTRLGMGLNIEDYLARYHAPAAGDPVATLNAHRPLPPPPPQKTPKSTPAVSRSQSMEPARSPQRRASINFSSSSPVSAFLSVSRTPSAAASPATVVPRTLVPPAASRTTGKLLNAQADALRQAMHFSVTPYADAYIPVTAGSTIDLTLALGGLHPTATAEDVAPAINPYFGYAPVDGVPAKGALGGRRRVGLGFNGAAVGGCGEAPLPPYSHHLARLQAAVGTGVIAVDSCETNRRIAAYLLVVPPGADPYGVTPDNCAGITPIMVSPSDAPDVDKMTSLDLARGIARFYKRAQERTGNTRNICELDMVTHSCAASSKGPQRASVRALSLAHSDTFSTNLQRSMSRASVMPEAAQLREGRGPSIGSRSMGSGSDILPGLLVTQPTDAAVLGRALQLVPMAAASSHPVAMLFSEAAPLLAFNPNQTADAIHSTTRREGGQEEAITLERRSAPRKKSPPQEGVKNRKTPPTATKTHLELLVDDANDISAKYRQHLASKSSKRPTKSAQSGRALALVTSNAAPRSPLAAVLVAEECPPPPPMLATLPPHAAIKLLIPPTSHVATNLYVLYVAPVDPTVQMRPGVLPPALSAHPSIGYGSHYNYGDMPPPQYLREQLASLTTRIAQEADRLEMLKEEQTRPANVSASKMSSSPARTKLRVGKVVTIDPAQGLRGRVGGAAMPLLPVADRIAQSAACLASLRTAKESLEEEASRPLHTPHGLIRPLVIPLRIVHPNKPQQAAIVRHVDAWSLREGDPNRDVESPCEDRDEEGSNLFDHSDNESAISIHGEGVPM